MKRLKKFLYSALLTSFVILGSVSVFAGPVDNLGGDTGGGSGGYIDTDNDGVGDYWCEYASEAYTVAPGASEVQEGTVSTDTNNSLDISGSFENFIIGDGGGMNDDNYIEI